MKFLKKYHKWVSIIFSLFILLFSISGIILNHRELFAKIDINRKYLPESYSYKNWNNSSIRGSLQINNDSILFYGNVGIWLTDSEMFDFSDFNFGFPEGVDNRKISTILKTKNNELLAGSFFGLYKYNYNKKHWNLLEIPGNEKRIVDIIEVNDTVNILTRSNLIRSADLKNFVINELPQPQNYNNKIGLFKTLWVIHSGEIYGTTGKIIVDITGIIFAFLTITGFILFINKIVLKKKKISKPKRKKIIKINLWNIKWHNKIGWTTTILLLITASTGIFLRPPFLIPIAEVEVKKIPFSELDTPSSWLDKLRSIRYDESKNRYIISTLDGMFYSDDNFKSNLIKYSLQPPVSVMGINAIEIIGNDSILVGSFEGMFLWQPDAGKITDYITLEPYVAPEVKGPPIGKYLIAGISKDNFGNIIYFDYNTGAKYLRNSSAFADMPKEIESQPMSLWNLNLEIHTGRIFQFLIKDFYILIVPLTGLAVIFILISGFIVWYKLYRKVKYKKMQNIKNPAQKQTLDPTTVDFSSKQK